MDKLIDILIPNFETSIFVMIMIVFYIGGVIKGFLGIGLPAAAMALLTLFINPLDAIALIILPIIFTNAMQFVGSQNRKQIMFDYKFCAVAIIISIFITSIFINSYPSYLITMAIGTAMVAFSLNQLVGFRIPIGPNRIGQIIAGVIAGVLGGLSSIWSPPIVMYLFARGVSKETFIATTGFLFLAGSIPLALGYFLSGVLTIGIIFNSLVGLFVVVIGFKTGEHLRQKISQELFKKIVLWSFLIMGVRLLYTGFITI